MSVPKTSSQAQLSLVFSRESQDCTFLRQQFCRYPFHLCRAQYLDPDQPDIATVYLQSCAGGIFADDRLENRFVIESAARAQVTTQASTVVHRMREGRSRQRIKIIAETESRFEYLPDPLILFPEAEIESCVEVILGRKACVLVYDSFLMHDPGSAGEPFRKLQSTIQAKSHDGVTLFVDHFELYGADFKRQAIGMQGPHAVHCNFLVLTTACHDDRLFCGIRNIVNNDRQIFAGVSKLPNHCGISVRVLAHDCATAQRTAVALWKQVRQLQLGTEPQLRRK